MKVTYRYGDGTTEVHEVGTNDPLLAIDEAQPDRHDVDVVAVEFAKSLIHTIRGEAIGPNGSPYGVTHDYDCPACVASGSSFTASPRSETYWSS